MNWAEKAFDIKKIPADVEEFWVAVSKENCAYELAKYALTCLVMPVSNAAVERGFSVVAAVKNKARNRMQLDLLSSIIRIKTQLMRSNKCCVDFEQSSEMLKNFSVDILHNSASCEHAFIRFRCYN